LYSFLYKKTCKKYYNNNFYRLNRLKAKGSEIYPSRGSANRFSKDKNKNKKRDGKLVKKALDLWTSQKVLLCVLCARTSDELIDGDWFEVDHINPLVLGGRDEIKNLQPLCCACHKLKNWRVKDVVRNTKSKEANKDESDTGAIMQGRV